MEPAHGGKNFKSVCPCLVWKLNIVASDTTEAICGCRCVACRNAILGLCGLNPQMYEVSLLMSPHVVEIFSRE